MYDVEYMSQNILKAGVIGWPVNHSLSPRLFNYWFQEHSITGSYKAYAVKKNEISELLHSMSNRKLIGFNVTVPHKQEIIKYLDCLSDSAKKIGAVNTITLKDNLFFGDNTDGYGFIENLKQNSNNLEAIKGVCIVLGAGGAARAIVNALVNFNAKKIIIINRTREKAEKLASDISGPITVVDWCQRNPYLEKATFVVNTTILGMKGNPPLDLDLSSLPKQALVNDIVYVPIETKLLRDARARGNPTVDGIGMLLHQARPGFMKWFGKDPFVSENLRHYILKNNGN